MKRSSYLRNIIRKIIEKDPNMDRIDSVTFKITDECNLKCSMCGYARNRMSEQAILEGLRVDEWKRVVDELADLGVMYISILGGEPLLYPGLFEVLEHIRKRGIQSGITTNGVHLRQHAEQLMAVGLHRINVSLDAFPDVHDRIRGVEGTFAAAMEGIKHLSHLRGGHSVPEMIVNVVVSEENQNLLEDYLHYLEQIPEVDRIFLVLGTFTTVALGEQYAREMKESFQCDPSSWQGFVNCLGKIDPEKIARVYLRIKNGEYKKKITIFPPLPSVDDIDTYYEHPEEHFGWVEKCCWKPWFGVDVRANGDVAVCNDWPDYLVGNVRNESLATIWNGEKMHTFRKYLMSGKDFAICMRCPWRYLPNFFLVDP